MSKTKIFSSLLQNFKNHWKITADIYEHSGDAGIEGGFLEKIAYTVRTKRKVDEYLFSEDKKPLIEIDGRNNAPKYPGEFFIRSEESRGTAKLKPASFEEILNSNILCIGGLDFDSSRCLSALNKFAAKLALMNPAGKKAGFGSVAVFPEVSKEERYEAAVKYSLDPRFYPPYIKDRVEKFIMPKILDEDNDTLLCVQHGISLFALSVGGREVMMMENALRDILSKELDQPTAIVNDFLKNVRAVCLGYAPSLHAFKEGGFNKTFVFSRDDRAVLIPEDFYDALLTKEELSGKNIYAKDFRKTEEAPGNSLIICGNGFTKINSGRDDLGHTLPSYAYAISEFPEELKELIGSALVCDGF